jgi:hypothetical protein
MSSPFQQSHSVMISPPDRTCIARISLVKLVVDCAPFRKQPEAHFCVTLLWYNENKFFSISQAFTITGQPLRWILKKLRIAHYEELYTSHFHLQRFASVVVLPHFFPGAGR